VTTSETRRQNLYFPGEMLSELQNEAKRQDRSISWLIQQAWRIARKELRRIPSTTDYLPDSKDSADTRADDDT
jgi:uncharacterized small protein (TIGR04563 family)